MGRMKVYGGSWNLPEVTDQPNPFAGLYQSNRCSRLSIAQHLGRTGHRTEARDLGGPGRTSETGDLGGVGSCGDTTGAFGSGGHRALVQNVSIIDL